MSRLEREMAAAVDARIIADMRKRADNHPTQPIPRQSLAECAAEWRKQLSEQGLVRKESER